MPLRWRRALAVLAGAVLIVSPVTAARDGAEDAPRKPQAAMRAAPPLDRERIVPMLMPRWGKGPTEADIVDPQMTVVEEIDLGDHIRRRLSYYVEKGEKVYGYLLLPKDRGSKKLPLVMCPHPTNRTGKDMVVGKYDGSRVTREEALKRTFRSYGLDLVRHGYICFAPDAPGFGERAPFPNDPGWESNMKGYQAQLKKRWPTWQYHAKCLWDLQRALDFLVKLEEVDPKRVASIGHSLGGWHSLWFAGMDERIQATVINAAGNIYFKQELWEDRNALMKYLSDSKAQSMYANTNTWLMAIAPRPVLYIKALNDIKEPGEPNVLDGFRLISDYYRQAAAIAGKGRVAPFAVYFHNGGHSFHTDARELTYHWLARQLDGDTKGSKADAG